MKKILYLILLSVWSITTAYGQAADFIRTNANGNNSGNSTTFNKSSVIDANLKARLTFFVPKGSAFTLNNARDSAGAVFLNTATGRLGIYLGSGVWKSLATTDDTPTISATSPIDYTAGIISIQVANGSQDGYLDNVDWTNFNTAYTDRLKWDGGATDLVAGTGRTSLGGTTVGQSIFTSTNPSAITFLRANADNTVTWLDAASFRTAIGASTGTVTSVSGTSNRITSTGGTTPVIDISSSYIGQTSITTLGNIIAGSWGAGPVAPNGGSATALTAFNNSASQPAATFQNTNASGNIFELKNSVGTIVGTASNSGGITALNFVKTGGTSSQFLKADGSVDANTYLTTTGSGTGLSGVVLLAGNQSISDNKTFTGRLISSVNIEVAKVLEFTAQSNLVSHASTSAVIYANGSQGFTFDATSLTGRGGSILFPVHGGTPKVYTLPNTTGTVLLDNGSGSGLSGVVLTSTNQTGLSGNKSWTGTHTFVTTGISPTTFQDLASNGRVMQATAGDGEVAWFYNNSATDPTLTLFNTGGGNLITGYNAFAPDVEVFRIAGSGAITSSAGASFSGALTGTSATFSGLVSQTRDNQMQQYTASTSTSSTYSVFTNGGGQLVFGVNNSTGTTLLSGANGAYSSDIYTPNTALRFGTNSTLRYTIDASGNNTWTGYGQFLGNVYTPGIQVGSGTLDSKLNVFTSGVFGLRIGYAGGTDNYFDGANQYFRSETGVERLAITNSGFLKATDNGTYVSISGAYHELRTSVAGQNILFASNTAATNARGIAVSLTGATFNNNTTYLYEGYDNGNTRFLVYTNGGIANVQANDLNLSDRNSKKNITKAGSYWDVIKAIEFDKFNYKDQSDDRKLLGVVAQQVETVWPLWVSDKSGFKDKNGKDYKAVYEQQLQYGVNIVVQESMKRIEALEAEVKILKTK